MKQEEFEKLVMNKLLAGDDEMFVYLQKQYQQAAITSRKFTGYGFFTTFDIPKYKAKCFFSGRIDDVAVEFKNSKDDACFILYVENGKIDTLEGFTTGEVWSYDYDNAEIVYCLPDRRRYELK